MHDKKIVWLNYLTLATMLLAFLVLGLGAFTRLVDAGLGCPDWPGCYGHAVVPAGMTDLQTYKAWIEMVHRYFAGTLAVCIIGIAVLCVLSAARYGFFYLCLGLLIFLLVIYQALLGMWTVTLKLLPIIVTQHLMGGMTLLALLFLIYLKNRSSFLSNASPNALDKSALPRIFAAVGLVLVFLQIFLGAWTSTHNAALSCPDFPWCFPHTERQMIQVMHRCMALLLSVYLVCFSIGILCARSRYAMGMRHLAMALLLILGLQLIFGVLNVLLGLPLWTALLHHWTASILLLLMTACNFYMWVGEPA